MQNVKKQASEMDFIEAGVFSVSDFSSHAADVAFCNRPVAI